VTGESRPQGYWRIPELLPDLGADILAKLESFYSELIRFNQKVNLVPRRTELETDVAHFYDCIVGGKIVLEISKAKSIYDLGSGNGLPGIVMAVMDPSRQMVLVDADAKKIDFLTYVANHLALKNVRVLKGRIDELPTGEMLCAVTRGFSVITKAILLARHPMRVGGEFYHFKGSGWVTEVAQIPSQICTSWQPSLTREYELPIINTRQALICTKRIGT